jgi:3-hydroxyisobutyrate dehydrogenase-like beta-hydroxyacid dehydrogenase
MHPGAMGAAVGAQLVASGATVYWLPDGRSAATRRRAESAGLVPVDFETFVHSCELIISVCPPASAPAVAEQVAASAFGGTFLDANAISPQRSRQLAEVLGERGVAVVDGGIVGAPPKRPGSTRLYLSGPDRGVELVRAVFAETAVAALALPGPVGQASALKLAFAAYNKITQALAAQSYALAEAHGVRAELAELAGATLPGTPLGEPERLVAAGPRAWRWEPEMGEIADACAAAGLPVDLPEAAAAVFDRWAAHKDDDGVTLPELIADLFDPAR